MLYTNEIDTHFGHAEKSNPLVRQQSLVISSNNSNTGSISIITLTQITILPKPCRSNKSKDAKLIPPMNATLSIKSLCTY